MDTKYLLAGLVLFSVSTSIFVSTSCTRYKDEAIARHLENAERLKGEGITGTVLQTDSLPSNFVSPRRVEVRLPKNYETSGTSYPVVYMHDGQNVFNPATSYTGVDWGVDEAMAQMSGSDSVREAIIVAVWNSPSRFLEYMPEKAAKEYSDPDSLESKRNEFGSKFLADEYLKFLIWELKPAVDRTYRTQTGPDNTFIMGSSMGGLISMYAVCEYPDVYGAAGCISTHWPAMNGVSVSYLKDHVPSPGNHRLYFDHGTWTLDAEYAPYQRRADSLLKEYGYVEGDTFLSYVFEGEDHSEESWRSRVHIPLAYLLAKTE